MPLIDSHAHLGDEAFDPDLEEVIARAKEAGLTHIVNICTDEETLNKGLQMRSDFVHLAAATTPHDVEKEDLFSLVEKHLDDLVAIGETGLDYFYEHSPRKLQQDHLHRYLDLAQRTNKPVVIHCREAFTDFFSILDQYKVQGVLHCFTGTQAEAEGVIERGFYLSLSGIVTYKKSEALREVAKWVPLDRLLIETDAPYLAPQKWRGKRCEPAYVTETARVISEVRNEEIAIATAENARRLFRL